MNRIKELRASRNMKQADLAATIKVSQAALSGYETGKFQADIETYMKIATYFDVSLDYLLGRDEKEKPTPVSEGGPTLPPEYEFLNPTNKAIVDRLIADLVKGQPSGPKLKIYAAALDGGRYETEADADITLPESVQALPDEYKGKTAGIDPARQEQ